MSLTESFITSIRAQHKSANTAISKDVGIYIHTLHPTHTIKSTFKKSSTPVNALAASSTHIFAAQADKAVVNVYSRERGNHEALVSFPERIHSLALVGDGLLVLGTAEGRAILWEAFTGRQVSTPTAHLQPVTCVAATQTHLITGSEDSNIHVWSIPTLLSLSSNETHEPVRSLSHHRAAITSLAMGHSTSTTNICVSGSKDNTCIVWNYHSGTRLRTFLFGEVTPLCLILEPCDRAVYVGCHDGSLQVIDFVQQGSAVNPLYDTRLQDAPVTITSPPWKASFEPGAAHCLGLSYDGTSLLSGHASGKVVQWDACLRSGNGGELADLNAPVTNLLMLSPFEKPKTIEALTIVKPKVGEGNYTFTAEFIGRTDQMHQTPFERVLRSPGFPSEVLEAVISSFSRPAATTAASGGDDKLRKENEELKELVKEQRALQKKTFEKYSKLKSGLASS